VDLGVDSTLVTDSMVHAEGRRVRYLSDPLPGRIATVARSLLEQAPLRTYRHRAPGYFSPGLLGRAFLRLREVREAEILHLHWVNGGLVDVRDLRRFPGPIVWTVRDMWPITGGCHYAGGCERFTSGCGRCPQLGSSRDEDLSSRLVRRKLVSYRPNMTFVGISEWMAGEVRRSLVGKGREVRVIGNAIRATDFFPVRRPDARAALGLDTAKRVVLVGSLRLGDPYKGFDLFVEAMAMLDRGAWLVAGFGEGSLEPLRALGFEARELGYLGDAASLRRAYSAADVFVAPSRMEAFGKTVAEAMACETPVVCFDATGPRDVVDHRVSGYRAIPFDAADLAEGIRWVTETAEHTAALGTAGRRRVEQEFEVGVAARRYVALYEELMRAGRPEREGGGRRAGG
jgi:glycosyltransferase involved in cell wall biosynthesis